MMQRAALLLFVVLAFSHAAPADQPPSWSDFEEKSANSRFVAEVKARAGQGDKNFHEMEYELGVYELVGEGRRKLWSTAYHYDGYPGGLLSDDGSVFIYVSFWYYGDAPVVSIYRAGQGVKVIRGEEFEIDPSRIQKTASHELWLSDEPGRVEFSGSDSRPLVLRIRTIDKKLHQVDAETGMLLK